MPVRALGGGELVGDKLVRLVYVDEAGIGNADQEPWLVVAFVVVDADKQLSIIEEHIDTIVKKHIPKQHQEGFVFHAKDLFNGGGVFDRDDPMWTLEKRLEIAHEIADIPSLYNLPIAFGAVERAEFPLTKGLPPEWYDKKNPLYAHVSAFMTGAMLVEHWMRAKADDEHCLMIVEDNQVAHKMILEQQSEHQSKRLSETLKPKEKDHFPFRKIKHNPLFENKRESSILAIADFCAYVYKRFLMNRTHKLYLPFYDKVIKTAIWSKDGEWYP